MAETRYIPVTIGKDTVYAIVDEKDFEKVSQRKWSISLEGHGYPQSAKNGESSTLHAFIMKKRIHEKKEGSVIDHADGDKLNNTNANLEFVSRSHNCHNRDYIVGEAGYRGVIIKRSKYAARIAYNNTTHSLGSFADAEDAAKQYDMIAIRLYGEKAKTNNLLTSDEIEICIQNPMSEADMKLNFRLPEREPLEHQVSILVLGLITKVKNGIQK